MKVYILMVNPAPEWTDDMSLIMGVYKNRDDALHDGIDYCSNNEEMRDYYEERKEEDGEDYTFENFVEGLFFEIVEKKLKE